MKGFNVSASRLANEAGCSEETLQLAATAVLRALHRAAVTHERSATAAVMAARFAFGAEASYHLAGLFEHARIDTDSGLPWSETMLRLDPSARVYASVALKWERDAREGQGDNRPESP